MPSSSPNDTTGGLVRNSLSLMLLMAYLKPDFTPETVGMSAFEIFSTTGGIMEPSM